MEFCDGLLPRQISPDLNNELNYKWPVVSRGKETFLDLVSVITWNSECCSRSEEDGQSSALRRKAGPGSVSVRYSEVSTER